MLHTGIAVAEEEAEAKVELAVEEDKLIQAEVAVQAT